MKAEKSNAMAKLRVEVSTYVNKETKQEVYLFWMH